jgi:hypothetical protein
VVGADLQPRASSCTPRPGRPLQGRANGSRGCINLSKDAAWFFWLTRRGDMVEVVGALRRPGDSLGVADRNMSCSAWYQAAPWSGA